MTGVGCSQVKSSHQIPVVRGSQREGRWLQQTSACGLGLELVEHQKGGRIIATETGKEHLLLFWGCEQGFIDKKIFAVGALLMKS